MGRRVATLEDTQRAMARQHRRVQRVVDDVRSTLDSRERADEAGNLRKLRSEVEGGAGKGGKSGGGGKKDKGGRGESSDDDDENDDEGDSSSDEEDSDGDGGRRGKRNDLIGSLAGASLSSGLGGTGGGRF